MSFVVLDGNFDWASLGGQSGNTLAVRSDFVGGASIDMGGSVVPLMIDLPLDVTLLFEGGSFSEVTIKGANTRIKAPIEKIFNLSVTLTETFVYDTFYPEWFGAKGDNETNDFRALSSTFTFADHVTLTQKYSIGTDGQVIVDRSGSFTLVGYNSVVTNNDPNASMVHLIQPIFEFRNLDNLTIKGITIDGNLRIANALYIRDIDQVTLEDITVFDLLYATGSVRTVAIRIDINNPSTVYGNNLNIYDINGGENNNIGDLDVGIARAIYCVVNQTDTANTKVTFENSCFEWVYGDDGDIIHIVDKNYISDAKHRFIFDNCTIRYAFRRLVKGSASGIQYYNCRFDTASLDDLKAKMGIIGDLPSEIKPSGGVNFRHEDPKNPDHAHIRAFRNMHGKMINCEYRNSGNLDIGLGHTLIAAYTDGVEIRGNEFYDSYVRFQNKTSNFLVDNNQFYNSNIATDLIQSTDPILNEWEEGISYITNNYGRYAPAGSSHSALVDAKNDLISVSIQNNKVYSVEDDTTTVGFHGLLRHTRISGTTNNIVAKDVVISGNEIIRTNSARKEYIIVADATWYNTCKIFNNYFSVKNQNQAYTGANFTNGVFVGFYWNNRGVDGNEIGIY